MGGGKRQGGYRPAPPKGSGGRKKPGRKSRPVGFMTDFYALARVAVFVVAMALIGLNGAQWVSALYLAAGLLSLPGAWVKTVLDRLRIREWIALVLSLALILTGVFIRPPKLPSLEPVDIPSTEEVPAPAEAKSLLSELPAYGASPWVEVNGNEPFFTKEEITKKSFERYGALDELGRCGACLACVGQDLMPTEPRGSIYEVKPTGWHSIRYDFIDGESLYNRCHLIGFQLTGENANPNNLITGTRYLNTEGMLPFENEVANYVKTTGNHVLYRVTPLFQGRELVARGVLMEALSVEDDGAGVRFCVYCYNVQPQVYIDYATGDASLVWDEAG